MTSKELELKIEHHKGRKYLHLIGVIRLNPVVAKLLIEWEGEYLGLNNVKN